MYLGPWNIDDVLYVPINTIDDDVLAFYPTYSADASAVPTYRVYENSTSTAILTGNTAKLDDTNTTGLYQVALTLSAANGFEAGKCYTVYLEYNTATGNKLHTEVHFFHVWGKVKLTQLAITAASNDDAILLAGAGTGHGIKATGGATGDGMSLNGGATSGDGLRATGANGNSRGMNAVGQGSAAGFQASGGATGHGFKVLGGATSGDGLNAAGNGAGDGIQATGTGGGLDFSGSLRLSATGIDDILDEVCEGTLTLRQMMRLVTAFVSGKADGGGTTTLHYRDVADAKNRITNTVDSSGNRSASTLDVS